MMISFIILCVCLFSTEIMIPRGARLYPLNVNTLNASQLHEQYSIQLQQQQEQQQQDFLQYQIQSQQQQQQQQQQQEYDNGDCQMEVYFDNTINPKLI